MKKIIFILIIGFFWWKFYYVGTAPSIGPGAITTTTSPYKGNDRTEPVQIQDHTLSMQGTFYITARVIAVEKYYFDKASQISPIDITLGWGAMSDESVYSKVDSLHMDRLYEWRLDSLPISDTDVVSSTINLHIIPASGEISRQINRLKIGDLINLNGTSVSVANRITGWKWQSNNSKRLSGQANEEIIYVNELNILEPSL